MLAQDTYGETVGVYLRGGGIRHVKWRGFITRLEAMNKPNSCPVKLEIHSYRVNDEIWTVIGDREYVQGCLVVGVGVFGVLDQGQPRVV